MSTWHEQGLDEQLWFDPERMLGFAGPIDGLFSWFRWFR